jgi:hypothetical protein
MRPFLRSSLSAGRGVRHGHAYIMQPTVPGSL